MKKIPCSFLGAVLLVLSFAWILHGYSANESSVLISIAHADDAPFAKNGKPDSPPVLPLLESGNGRTIEELEGLAGVKLPPNLPTFKKGFQGIKDPVKATESFFLNYIISPIFLLAAGVAVIMILYASFRIITARGEEEGITKAKTTLIWAAAGLALIMLAYTLVRNISTIITDLEKPEPAPAATPVSDALRAPPP